MAWRIGQFLTTVAVMCNGLYAEDLKNSDATQTKPGIVWIEEDDWAHLSDEPGRHLDHAREAFVEVDARKAAAELRKAAAYLRISARDAADRTRTSLNSSVKELDALAGRMERGAVKSVADVDAAAARAYHALAEYQNAKARKAWADEQRHRAGRFWRAATMSLERSTARTEAAFRNTTQEVVRESRVLSGRLIEGTGYVADEVGQGLETFGKQVELAGKRLEPHR